MTVESLERALVDHIGRHGPMGFDEYVAHALYTPELGFYAAGGGAGRGRDFLTSPEVGPLFGSVVSRALDAWWEELGRPDPFVVVEAGAGRGMLARTVLTASPSCAPVLRMVLVEPAQSQWTTHPDQVESRIDLPPPGALGDGPVVVLANELLDNLPFGLVERTEAGWREVVVDLGDGADGPVLVEGTRSLTDAQVRWCRSRSADAPTGARMPVQADVAAWLGQARELANGGRVVVFDYFSTSAAMAARPWREWLRTFARHGRAGHPLEEPGSCDITVEVALDQLAEVAEPTVDRSQAEFLGAHGLEELVAEGRAAWQDRTDGRIDLAAIAARSRVTEAEALTEASGLGAFRVLEWVG